MADSREFQHLSISGGLRTNSNMIFTIAADTLTRLMRKNQQTDGRKPSPAKRTTDSTKGRWMKSTLYWITSVLARASGRRGLTLLLGLVCLLSWFLQPWQWQVWSEFSLALGVLRVVAYTVMAISFLYNAIDDTVRGRRTDIVWASLAFLFAFSIGTLSLDLVAIVAWVDTRSALTAPALFAAWAVAWQTSRRILDRQPMKETSDEHIAA